MAQLYTSRIDEFSVCHTSTQTCRAMEHIYGETQDSIACIELQVAAAFLHRSVISV